MRPASVLLLLLATALAGCTEDASGTFRFKGQLDRDLDDDEQEEIRRLAGKDYQVESTAVGCPPEVDPYDCNQVWLRVDGITEGLCERMVAKLDGRTYWRGAPTCDQPPAG